MRITQIIPADGWWAVKRVFDDDKAYKLVAWGLVDQPTEEGSWVVGLITFDGTVEPVDGEDIIRYEYHGSEARSILWRG